MDYREVASEGQAITELLNNRNFKIFIDKVLKPIEEEALEILTTSPADDKVAIIGGQQRKKVVDSIYKKMNSLVEEGRLALDYLKDSNPDEDGGIA